MNYNHVQDTVNVELSIEESIVSDTVKVSIDVVLATKAADATDVRGTILTSLKSLLDIDWAFTRLDRQTNRSGLEEVFATATARIPENQASGLTAKAVAASREGLQLTVSNLDYNPARNVVEATIVELRKKLYAKAQEEATALNEFISGGEYPWRVGSVNFYDNSPRMKVANNARGMMLESTAYSASVAADSFGGEAMDLTQKVGLSASVALVRLVK